MSTQLTYTGGEYTTPDHTAGYGTAIANPSTLLSGMVTSQYYFREAGGDIDVVFVSAESFLCSFFKSCTNQKLLQSFVIRMTSVGGQNKLRFVHRNLATTFTFEQALRATGVDITVSDDYSASNMATINQQLAPIYIQVYKA